MFFLFWERLKVRILLKKNSWLHPDHNVRLSEVENITNQKLLEYIALNDPYSYKKRIDIPSACYPVREAAIDKLENKKVLREMKSSLNCFVREAASHRLDYLEYGISKTNNTDEDYEDKRNDMDPHQSSFDFK